MAFAIGIGLNAAFVVIEALYGFGSNSMALVADAGHNLSDVLGLVVAWIAVVLSRRPPSPRFTYGLRSSSILAALFNAVFLLVAVGAIAWEAVLRLMNPAPVASMTVLVVAGIGIAINGLTALLFAAGREGDLNIRGAYLHMLADAAVSLGVVVGALVIMATAGSGSIGHQPRHRRRHRCRDMEPAARQHGDVAQRGAALDRSGRRARLPKRARASPGCTTCISGRRARRNWR